MLGDPSKLNMPSFCAVEKALTLAWNTFETCLLTPLTLINIWGGRNHHPLSEDHYFYTIKHQVDLRPVCKLEFVHCGSGEKNQSPLSFSVEAWRPDEVWEHLFPKSEIDIFIDFCRFSTNFPNFQKILDSTPLYTYLSPCKNRICKIR